MVVFVPDSGTTYSKSPIKFDLRHVLPTGNPIIDARRFDSLKRRFVTRQPSNVLDVYESMYGNVLDVYESMYGYGFDPDTRTYLDKEQIYDILASLEGGDADTEYALEREDGDDGMYGGEKGAEEETIRIFDFWEEFKRLQGSRSRKTRRKSKKGKIHKRKSIKRKIHKRKSKKGKIHKRKSIKRKIHKRK